MFVETIERLSQRVSDQLGSTLIILLLLLIPLVLKGTRRYIIDHAQRVLTRYGMHSTESVAMHNRVYETTVLLRERLNSHRACVYQFHNGEEFFLSNPFWKITNTYESVRPGTSYEAHRINSMMVSLVLDFVHPFYHEGLNEGVTNLTKLLQAHETLKVSDGRKVFHYDYRSFRIGLASQIMREIGVSHSLVTNLVSPNGKTYGIVAAHYNHLFNESNREANIIEISKAAEEIQYLLSDPAPAEKKRAKKWKVLDLLKNG